MEQLRCQIKSNSLEGLYLFTGEEKFLIKSYERSFIKTCLTNGTDLDLSLFEGKNAIPDKIMDAADTPPFLNDKRLVIVKESGLFTTKRKEDSEKIADYLKAAYSQPKGAAVLLFIEDSVDKRGKAYKTLNKLGKAVFFEPLREGQLITWINGEMRKLNLSISSATASYLLRCCAGSMEGVYNEIEKLSSYKISGVVTKEDIDSICSKTSEARIFDLIDAVAAKNNGLALMIYNELLAAKEQPLGILAMLSRQFRLVLKCKLLLDKGIHESEIIRLLGERPYSIKIASSQAKGFTKELLEQAALDSVDCDTKIKTGFEGDRLGVEMLIMKYSG